MKLIMKSVVNSSSGDNSFPIESNANEYCGVLIM